ncbi:hypothetical protein PUN28_020680 [Cardiocondyla obscurior]|uniref:Uncharacterized protein n=1 Tax=Cardiocondyla obscurior TaxID=286306 RepID=A0AAW2E4Y2_9HYME
MHRVVHESPQRRHLLQYRTERPGGRRRTLNSLKKRSSANDTFVRTAISSSVLFYGSEVRTDRTNGRVLELQNFFVTYSPIPSLSGKVASLVLLWPNSSERSDRQKENQSSRLGVTSARS